MSDVKQRVIRIVNGLPPEEPKVLVELRPDETVVKSELMLAFEKFEFNGGEVPAGTTYIVGAQPSDHILPRKIIEEMIENLKHNASTDEARRAAPDPTGTVEPVSSKPFVKFKMYRSTNHICPEPFIPTFYINGLGYPKIVLN